MSDKIILKELTAAEINQAAEISVASFDSYNITMNKLGVNYLKKVYFPEMIQCDGAGAIAAMNGNKLLGYYCYQKDFRAFSNRLSKKNFFKTSFYLMLSVLKFKMLPRDIYNLFKIMSWIDKHSTGLDAQVGPIAVSPDIKGTTQGGMISYMIIKEVLRKLKSEGVKTAWSTVDERNPSQFVSKSFGFEDVASIKLWGAVEHFHVKTM
jgi:hypothetical protein